MYFNIKIAVLKFLFSFLFKESVDFFLPRKQKIIQEGFPGKK